MLCQDRHPAHLSVETSLPSRYATCALHLARFRQFSPPVHQIGMQLWQHQTRAAGQLQKTLIPSTNNLAAGSKGESNLAAPGRSHAISVVSEETSCCWTTSGRKIPEGVPRHPAPCTPGASPPSLKSPASATLGNWCLMQTQTCSVESSHMHMKLQAWRNDNIQYYTFYLPPVSVCLYVPTPNKMRWDYLTTPLGQHSKSVTCYLRSKTFGLKTYVLFLVCC